MAQNSPPKDAPATSLPRRNLLIFAAGLLTIGAGYAVLSAGSGGAEAASVLLVIGYCVLLPLALVG